jgi:hypothetical protein
MLTFDMFGQFTWNYGNRFFIETAEGNFVWSDPDYPGGNNTILPFQGDYEKWCRVENIPYGRDKGYHKIGDYCGKYVW